MKATLRLRTTMFGLLAILSVFSAATASTEIENAKSPDGKFTLAMSASDNRNGNLIALKDVASGKALIKFDPGDYDIDDQRYRTTAVWRDDSGAVALNISQGRNFTICQLAVRLNGRWMKVAIPEQSLKAVRQKNTRPNGPEREYLNVTGFTAKGVELSYAGNIGVENQLKYALVLKPNPHLDLLKVTPQAEAPPRFDYEDWTFNVLAGGTKGYEDGTGSAAKFDQPHGVAVDRTGNLFVSDRGNHVIRMVTPKGVVTTIAGAAGKFGRIDGKRDAARFWYPLGLAVDDDGTLYVADSGSDSIRKITLEGMVRTIAGPRDIANRELGRIDAEHLKYPTGVAVDKAGTVYVADANGFTIRKITPDGELSTWAGAPGVAGAVDGDAVVARFTFPSGIAVDGKGTLYISDKLAIRKMSTDGVVSTIAGNQTGSGTTDGVGPAAKFTNPWDVAVDSRGNVYVADSGSKSIRKITRVGSVKTLRPIGGAPAFESPVAITTDSNDQLYVADEGSNCIYVGRPARRSANEDRQE